MNWLIKTMANESRYYPIFLGCLCTYALVAVVLFGLSVNYMPGATKAICILLMAGAVIIGAGFRIAHNLCYAKVNGVNDDSENTV